ncbi:DUF2971 domain-containing protein [Afipia massiliensis]|uniref:DUF2971 domain-containing protein n=1 Tax=Afipia massiliensis TaxID=211460 RepID=A0A4U6BTK6_9BRAD|nr:DUF2971 domain-containing protein [Afipia massiliensis]
MVPAILFKYRADTELTEKVITGAKIWLPTAETLNDPLECKTGIIPKDWQQQQIREMEQGQLMGLFGFPGAESRETLFSLDRKQTRKWFKRLKKLPFDRKIKAMRSLYGDHGIELSDPRLIFKTLEKQLSSMGIFSLSDCPDNQPMWAHYAGDHTGIALGFSTAEGSKLSDPRHTFPVVYDTRKPVFEKGFLHEIQFYRTEAGGMRSLSKFSFDDPVLRAAVTTKPPAWSYEREWRYVEESSGLHDFPGELVSVIFGYRMSEQRRNYYRKLLRSAGRNVELFEVYISSSGSFDIKSCR